MGGGLNPSNSSVGLGPQFILWCLAEVEQLLSKSFLSCFVVPFLVLWLESRLFVLAFFCLCSLVFPGCWLLQPQIWNLGGKKKGHSTPCCSLGAVLPSSLHLLESSYVCLYIMSNIFLVIIYLLC